jgi:hypothetical protein
MYNIKDQEKEKHKLLLDYQLPTAQTVYNR